MPESAWVDNGYSTDQEIYLKIMSIKNTSGNNLTSITQGSNFRIYFSSNIPQKKNNSYTGYYIRVATEMDSINYQITQDNYITINNFPGLRSKTNSLILYGIVRTDNLVYELPGDFNTQGSEGEQINIPENGQIEYQNIYIPPVEIELVNSNLEKCDNLYNITANGEYIYVSDLRMNITSGAISIEKIEADGMNTITDSEILSNIFSIGYSDANSNYHLFNGIPTINDSKIEFKIYYTINLSNASQTQKSIFVPVINAYQVFSLIGKTKINNENRTVYGGIAIGQESTISQLGEPSFECKYPIYINGTKIGYYPNKDSITFSSEIIFTGVNDGDNIRFSIFLGQPIYATSVNLTGSLKVYGVADGSRSNGGYYYNNGTNTYYYDSSRGYYTTTYTINASAITLTNINYKSGIISFRGYCRETISTGPISLVPNSTFTIAFR